MKTLSTKGRAKLSSRGKSKLKRKATYPKTRRPYKLKSRLV